ncbi:MAG: hypothetical protein ACRD5L_03450, partial [Bryobacteraceae bacterium]
DATGARLRESPFTPERVLSALRGNLPGAKKLDLTGSVDPVHPATFREHGGSLWFRGKGPKRHALDPAVSGNPAKNAAHPHAGGDD